MRINRNSYIVFIAGLLLLALPPLLNAASVKLSWQPNSEPDLYGYNLYYGTQSRNYGPPVPVDNSATYTLSDLQDGIVYYFAVSAVDNSGNESGFSEEISKAISSNDSQPPEIAITSPVSVETYTTNEATINIAGTASDDQALKQITWTSSNGGSGIASGTTNWSINAIELAVGANTVTITATDTAGNAAQDTLTITYTKPTAGLTVVGVSSSSDDGHVAANTIDNDLSTRWSASGSGQWIQYDLGSFFTISEVSMAFYKGDERTANFEIFVSGDGSSWKSVFKGQSSGTTLQQESYSVSKDTGRFVRIVGYGNSSTDSAEWNSITEVDITGVASTAPDTTGPVVNILSPVTNGTYNTSTPSVKVSGTAADSGGVAEVTWSTSNGESGTATGTTNWSTPDISLQEGSTTVTISAKDAAGNSTQNTLTVVYNPTANHGDLTIIGTSSSTDDGHVAANTVDNDLSTRWSAKGDGQWVQYDLGSSCNISSVAVAFYKGNNRAADFEILVSDDASSWNSVYKGTSSGTTLQQEAIAIPTTTGRFVRLVGYGNSVNDWNSITEVDIVGLAANAL